MMRIITGRARGAKLNTLSGDATRPTLERTKEAIFSMLGDVRSERVLDLFAGSGQLGLEAVSRGAACAVFCDRSREAVTVVRQNIQKTRLDDACEVYSADYQAFLERLYRGDGFDLVFLDPPYALGVIPRALQLMLSRGLLHTGARIVCESGQAEDVFGGDEALAAKFEVLRQTRYGAAHVTILQYADGEVE